MIPFHAESTCCNGGTPKAPKPPKEKKVKPQKPKKGELIDKDSKEPKGVAAAKELAKATKTAPFQVRLNRIHAQLPPRFTAAA